MSAGLVASATFQFHFRFCKLSSFSAFTTDYCCSNSHDVDDAGNTTMPQISIAIFYYHFSVVVVVADRDDDVDDDDATDDNQHASKQNILERTFFDVVQQLVSPQQQ